jgi:hypothetical protein
MANLNDPLSGLTQLDLEISRVRSYLHGIQWKKDALFFKIYGHYPPPFPSIHRLPPDIMEKVFLFCLPSTRNTSMSNREGPLLLAQVCSSWRTLAYSSVWLWSNIHIPVPYLAEMPKVHEILPFRFPLQASRNSEHARRFDEEVVSVVDSVRRRLIDVQEWSSRAKSCPLSISVFVPKDFYNLPEVMHLLLMTLLPFSKQWKHLELDMAWTPREFTLLNALSRPEVPLLESLRLGNVNVALRSRSSRLQPDDWFCALLRAPASRSVHAFNITLHSLTTLGIAWPSLTELELFDSCMTTNQLVAPSSLPQSRQMHPRINAVE